MIPYPLFDPAMLVWLIPLVIWDTVWKGIGLWKAGRNRQLAWFVCILIFNTAGILPIVYLLWFQKKGVERKSSSAKAAAKKKKR